ncbi:hypothetical protein QUF63_13215 [Anaerolineales bacterium HSG25]|nr:hypothetical protein [Anaerolineales bacterium HSG25]
MKKAIIVILGIIGLLLLCFMAFFGSYLVEEVRLALTKPPTDGPRILYRKWNGLYVMRADGSQRARLIRETEGSYAFKYPVWSVDGTQILFIHEFDICHGDYLQINLTYLACPPGYTLYLISADGQQLEAVELSEIIEHDNWREVIERGTDWERDLYIPKNIPKRSSDRTFSVYNPQTGTSFSVEGYNPVWWRP